MKDVYYYLNKAEEIYKNSDVVYFHIKYQKQNGAVFEGVSPIELHDGIYVTEGFFDCSFNRLEDTISEFLETCDHEEIEVIDLIDKQTKERLFKDEEIY